MLDLRKFSSLGHANHGWLDAHHHFSFANYHDPRRMGWGALRVWNDDQIAPGAGFPPHPHADMEIITYVRRGAISHRDSLGNEGRTQAGDVQVMSAGTGITHAEFNQEAEPTTLFQIWIIPDQSRGKPAWGSREFPRNARAGQFTVLASGFPGDIDALPIRASARVVGATLAQGEQASYEFGTLDRMGYLVVAKGSVLVNGTRVGFRDGIAIAQENDITVQALEESEVVLVDASP